MENETLQSIICQEGRRQPTDLPRFIGYFGPESEVEKLAKTINPKLFENHPNSDCRKLNAVALLSFVLVLNYNDKDGKDGQEEFIKELKKEGENALDVVEINIWKAIMDFWFESGPLMEALNNLEPNPMEGVRKLVDRKKDPSLWCKAHLSAVYAYYATEVLKNDSKEDNVEETAMQLRKVICDIVECYNKAIEEAHGKYHDVIEETDIVANKLMVKKGCLKPLPSGQNVGGGKTWHIAQYKKILDYLVYSEPKP